ncbi:ESX secretion-associated protein EspG [Nocardia sp. CA2R105]|uniref:ESX secretion-associated protein EspG n=1 Tax=Nocardia coffeae TaxID=2873381 RepID=UPI001CA6617C|nr:ESX secretion-associated protein EspG [Nocardia coffeae]MBY8862759.1 ESX secretion-associated protein EspG [Nocardia coffeae]
MSDNGTAAPQSAVGHPSSEGVNEDPIAVDLNVDAALLLKHLVGIDSYPPVLALLPNIFRLADRDRVHEVVAEQLTEVGILNDGTVHPMVEHWLRCLYRPDVELVARILHIGPDGEPGDMLRLSLVRAGETHVLAIRCDDHVVIQPVFRPDRQLDTVNAALAAALGPGTALRFEPVTAPSDQLGEVLSEPSERRRGLVELGATPHTAGVLGRVFDEVQRRAEVVVLEHHDGSTAEPEACMSVFDTLSGRFVVSPSVAMDGQVWVNYAPGDDAALQAGIRALVELLPGRSWFDTSRTG